MKKFKFIICFLFSSTILLKAQNLVVDGAISSNANWNGQEAPWSATTYQNSYLTACGNNYVMEVDQASNPRQVVNGFVNGATYVLTFRYAWRTQGCGPSVNPTNLRIAFSDATAVLDYTLSVPNTVTAFAPFSYTFTNNAATTHTLQFTNPGNANTCGVIVDDISILRQAAPGAIPLTNLAYWIKAESISLPDNANVYAWMSQGNNVVAINAPCANRPIYKTGLASNTDNLVANFNPYLTFNGSTQYLDYTGANLNLMDNATSGAGQSFFSVYQGGSNALTYFGHRGTTDSRTWARTNRVIVANGTGSGTNNRLNNIAQTTRNNIIAVSGKSDGLNVSDLNGTHIAPSSDNANVDFLTVGVRRNVAGTYSEYFDGSLSEIIVFNTVLTNTQMHQVRSYLGTKYGATLIDNSATGSIDERSYIATNGTTVYWDYAANTAFHNNVTIIGRDDATALNQIRSISTDADAGSNTGSAMLDISNVTAFTNDVSYLAVGHNGTVIPNPGGADFFDVPATIQSRLKRVWKFQKTGTGVANSVSVRFNMTGFTPLTGANLRLLVSNSPVFSGASVIAGSYAAPYFTASLPTTGGVYFTVASTNTTSTPLPITLLDFNAKSDNSQVLLNWSTANELNSSYFSIERSSDGITFNEIEKVNAAGNAFTKMDYKTKDTNPISGISYYRLKLVDKDNTFTHSKMVSIVRQNSEAPTYFTIFPNPGKGEFTLDFSGIENNHELEISITDAKGMLVFKQLYYSKTINHNQVPIVLEKNAASGIYYCTITFEGIQKTIRIVVE